MGELPGDRESWVIYQASLLDLSGIVTGDKRNKNVSRAERSLCGVALQPWIGLRSNPSFVTGVREADSEVECERRTAKRGARGGQRRELWARSSEDRCADSEAMCERRTAKRGARVR